MLGRILCVNSSEVQHAWLFTFAEPNLIGFSERIEDDTPESCLYTYMREPNKPQILIQRNASNDPRSLLFGEENNGSNFTWGSNGDRVYEDGFGGSLRVFDELQLGAFRTRVISAFSSI